jgi:branched-chain amino acid transport system permease protein
MMSSSSLQPMAAADHLGSVPPTTAARPTQAGVVGAVHGARWRSASVWVAVVSAGLALPLLLTDRSMGLVVDAAIFGLFALSMGLLIRQSHMISLGHAAFYGGSAYTLGVATTRWGWDAHVAAITAVGVAIALSVLVGAVAVRLPGISLAMVTLAFGQGLYLLIVQPSSRELTGGLDGFSVRFDRFLWFEGRETTDVAFWPVVWITVILCALAINRLRRSRFGTLLEAIRDNEERARFCGYRTWWPRVAVFAMSGAIAGLAGVLFAFHYAFVAPSSAYWITTAFGLIAALIGGTGSTAGPLLGALVYVLAQDRLATSGDATLYLGLVFVIVVVFAPAGLTGLASRVSTRVRRGSR